MTFSHTFKQISKLPILRSLLLFFYGRAAITMSKELAPFIAPGSRVLDDGCGTGIIGSILAKNLKTSVVGTDVRDARQADIPFVLSNGTRLSFPRKAFDVVLISYVLHHATRADILLKEAKRVCRGKIIVYEDTPQNMFHRASCFLHGFSYGSIFGIEKKCKFRTRQEWLSLFQKIKLTLLGTDDIELFNPVHVTARSLFILSPPQSKTL